MLLNVPPVSFSLILAYLCHANGPDNLHKTFPYLHDQAGSNRRTDPILLRPIYCPPPHPCSNITSNAEIITEYIAHILPWTKWAICEQQGCSYRQDF